MVLIRKRVYLGGRGDIRKSSWMAMDRAMMWCMQMWNALLTDGPGSMSIIIVSSNRAAAPDDDEIFIYLVPTPCRII